MNSQEVNPPLLAKKLFYFLSSSKETTAMVGDIEEEYIEILHKKGNPAAKLWYWFQLFKSFPSFAVSFVYWNLLMYRNYLRSAVRNIIKYKGYSFINIFGLAIGLASSFYIILWIQNELSYDDFHEKRDNIYRVIIETPQSDANSHSYWSASPIGQFSSYSGSATGPALRSDFPEVVSATRFFPVSDRTILLKYKENSYYEINFALADKEFFDIFTMQFIKGDRENALSTPNSIVLTEKLANKYFGDDDPIGKVLNIEQAHSFTVTAVVSDLPFNSHIKFDSLIPFQENIPNFLPLFGTPNDNYVLLDKEANAAEFGEKIYNYFSVKLPGFNHNVLLQPLEKIHLHSSHISDIVPRGNIKYVYIFVVVGLMILVTACINFVNLTTARSGIRTKEIAVRKVSGALKSNLKRQFYTVSLFYCFLAYIIAAVMVFIFMPVFFFIAGKNISMNASHILKVVSLMTLIAILTGLAAGSYPAMYLSSLKPVLILKGVPGTGKRRNTYRKFMVVSQFVIAVTLILCTLVIFKQFKFMQQRNLGFEKDNVLYFELKGQIPEKFEILRTELLKNPDIKNTALSSNLLTEGKYMTANFVWEGHEDVNDVNEVNYVSANKNFLDTFNMNLLQGRNFSEDAFVNNSPLELIINESAVEMMEVDWPIGMKAGLNRGSVRRTIVGVVEDYHFASLHNEIKPLVIWVNPGMYKYVFINVRSDNLLETIGYIETKFEEIAPELPFEIHFLDEAFESLYFREKQIYSVFITFTIIANLVACLGLFGLTAFAVESRTKEIGIRKVLGASTSKILRLISREFLLLVCGAILISLPIAWYVMNKWLQDFAYRTEIGILTYILTSSIILLLVMFTVGYHSVRAAKTDPADSLRYE
ncbi:ABC transporter permease [candidate division KSB1 bacterium]